jgi:anti-sigma factor RsiW
MSPLKNLLHPKLSTLIALHDGELSPRRARRVESHLERCARCRSCRARIAAETAAFDASANCLAPLDLARGLAALSSRIDSVDARQAARERLRAQLHVYFGAGTARAASPGGSSDSDLLRRAETLFTTFLGRAAAAMVLEDIRIPLKDANPHHAV